MYWVKIEDCFLGIRKVYIISKHKIPKPIEPTHSSKNELIYTWGIFHFPQEKSDVRKSKESQYDIVDNTILHDYIQYFKNINAHIINRHLLTGRMGEGTYIFRIFKKFHDQPPPHFFRVMRKEYRECLYPNQFYSYEATI